MPLLVLSISLLIFLLLFDRTDKDPLDYEGDSYETYKKYCIPFEEKIYIITEGDYKGSVLTETQREQIRQALKDGRQQFMLDLEIWRNAGYITEQQHSDFVDAVLDEMIKLK